ncbi:MAG TPA: c-type cytochrome [Terriglobales bacterium]|nr:c-type cytochrome [Terriglobales bacterium]
MKINFSSFSTGLRKLTPARLICIPLGIYMLGVIALLPSSAVVGQAGDVNRGQQLFSKRCGGCHSLDNDKEGPRLRGVYGRKAGSVTTFKYSDALAKAGISWDDVSLDKWLTEPDKFIPDDDMDFHLDKPGERADVIAYLKQLSSK